MQYQRIFQSGVESALFKGRMIIMYGAHRTGKTTLLQEIAGKNDRSLYLDCNENSVRSALTDCSVEDLKRLVWDNTLVVIDEGQRVPNIGLTLKLLADHFPRVQVIAAGSMMLFDLANDRNMMLVAGKSRFYLAPLLSIEIPDGKWPLEKALIYGMYPEVVSSDDPSVVLESMVDSSLYADIFEHEIVRGKENLLRLLQTLALRVGSEISYNEVGDQLGLDKVTVGRYVKLLEQVNIVFRLLPYKRRLSKELNRLRKVYFYDLGLRNALIRNFNPLHLRQDVDALWENFFISERVKYNRVQQRFTTPFYWRTYNGTGLDYLEEEGERILAIKCSLDNGKWRKPSSFLRAYPKSDLRLVTRENYQEFL